MSLPDPVRKFLDQAETSLLLGPGAQPGRYDAVAAVVRDRIALRALVVPAGVQARAVGLFVESGPVTLVPPREWPLTRLRVRPAAGGWLTVLRFEEDVEVDAVLAALARQSVHRDGAVLSPVGFDPAANEPVVDAATLDLRDGATEALVASLRSSAGLRVTAWDDDAQRAVPGLAMAGVPITADSAPPGLEPIADALTAPVDLGDALAREEHSVVLRRAALDAWRGVWQPTVSVVLATRRPDMLEHAIDQVARQRGVEALELVLAPHGFTPDEAMVRDRLGPDVALHVSPQPESTLFGDVLDAAWRVSGGSMILKMDDDDWYSPDAIADLIRARGYSGAELVGMPAEFHYIEERDLTVRRGHTTELYATFVAGGTMMVDRSMLHEVGGFRSVRKFVDAQLLAAVRAAGGSIYRTHGLGYLLRRTASGHTWQVDLDYLLDPERVAATYEGFRPSRLMEL